MRSKKFFPTALKNRYKLLVARSRLLALLGELLQTPPGQNKERHAGVLQQGGNMANGWRPHRTIAEKVGKM